MWDSNGAGGIGTVAIATFSPPITLDHLDIAVI